MKNLLLVLMILGMLGGIGAAYFGLTEREKAIEAKDNAVEDKEDAIKEKKESEKDRDIAEKLQENAELKMNVAIEERDEAEKIAEEAEQKAQQADETRQIAEADAEEANENRDEMKLLMDQAITNAEKSREERDEALGRADASEDLKQEAQDRAEQLLKDLENAQNELAQIIESTDEAIQVAEFVNKFINILINYIEGGDNNFKDGLDIFNNAQTLREKANAIQRVQEAGKKYQEAKKRIAGVKSIGDVTLDIIKKTSYSITQNIICAKNTTDFLKTILRQRNREIPENERRATYLDVRRRKEKADKLMSEVCESILQLIEENKKDFLPTHLTIIKRAKDKFYQRWLPPPEGSEAASIEE